MNRSIEAQKYEHRPPEPEITTGTSHERNPQSSQPQNKGKPIQRSSHHKFEEIRARNREATPEKETKCRKTRRNIGKPAVKPIGNSQNHQEHVRNEEKMPDLESHVGKARWILCYTPTSICMATTREGHVSYTHHRNSIGPAGIRRSAPP